MRARRTSPFRSSSAFGVERQAKYARVVDGARKLHGARRQPRETDTGVIGFVADEEDRRVTERAGLLDSRLHQRDPDATAAFARAHGERPEQKGLLTADEDRPEADRTDERIVLDGDEAQLLSGSTPSRNR